MGLKELRDVLGRVLLTAAVCLETDDFPDGMRVMVASAPTTIADVRPVDVAPVRPEEPRAAAPCGEVTVSSRAGPGRARACEVRPRRVPGYVR